MKADELREKDDAALRKELKELHREGFKLRMQRGTGQLGRPSEVKRVRREYRTAHDRARRTRTSG